MRRVLRNTESPEQESHGDKHRSVCYVLTGADASAKTVGEVPYFLLRLQLTVGVEPTLRVELLRVGESDRIARDGQ